MLGQLDSLLLNVAKMKIQFRSPFVSSFRKWKLEKFTHEIMIIMILLNNFTFK